MTLNRSVRWTQYVLVALGWVVLAACSGGDTSAARLTSLTVTPANPSLASGSTRQLTATGSFSDGSQKDLTEQASWSSSNAAVASVSGSGLAAAVAPGTATLSAAVEGITGSTTVTVTEPSLVSIGVTPTDPSVARGTTQQLTAMGTYADGTMRNLTEQVVWTSSAATIVTVSSLGLASAVAPGSATLSATLSGVTGSTLITVTSAQLVSIAVTPSNLSLARGTTRQLTATGSYSDATTQDLTTQVTWASSDTSVASVSNAAGSIGLASALASGSATLSATLSGVTGSTLLTVTPAQLVSLAVTPTNPSLARGTNRQLTATGTYSDTSTQDLTTQVTWASSNSAVVTVSNAVGSAGLASAVATGSAILSATLSGVTGSTTLTVTPAQLLSLSVTPSSPSLARGTTRQLTATGTYSDASTQDLTTQVTWASSNSAVVTVSNAVGSAGLASAVATGSATLSATLSGVTGSTTVTVTPAQLVSLSVTPTNPSLARGTTRQLTATGTYSDASTQDLTTQVTWASSNSAVATVSNAVGSAGLASAIATGSATLSATLSGVTGSTTLTVTPAQLVSLSVTPSNPSVARGRSQQLTATGTYSDASTQDLTTQVTWSSSNSAVATVSNAVGSAGLASAIATGSATLSATLSGVTGSTTLTVTPAQLVSLSITPSNPSLARGTTRQFTATGTYSDASTQDLTTQVTWASSNPAVATVSNAVGSAGLASAIATGSATLSATLSGVTGSTSLTVTPAQLVSLSVTPSNPSVARGRSQQLTATGTYSDASTQDLTTQVTWSSSNSAIATVSNAVGSTGLASAIATGSATLSATLSGVTGSTTLTVTPAQLVSLAVTPTNPSVARGTTRQFTATGTYSDASTQDLTTQVTWASSNSAVATVSNAVGSAGLASAIATGSATLSATLSGVTGSTTLTVTPAQLVSLAVTPTNPSLARGTTRQLTATGTYSDASTQDLTTQVTWSSSNSAVATVSNAVGSAGLASAIATGSATLSATLSGVTGSTTLTVTPAQLVSLSVTPSNPSVARGRSQQLTATGTYSDASTQDLTTQVTWSSSNSAVATVSNAVGSAGLASAIATGSATLSATLSGVTGSTTLTVTPAQLVSLSVTPSNPSVARGRSQQLTATGTYSDASTQDLTTQVIWASSDASIATVSNAVGSAGLASAIATGSATLSATLSGVTGSTILTVTPAQLVSLSVTPSNPSVARGRTQQLTATGTYSDASTQDLTTQVTWSSSNSAVATVSNAVGSAGLASAIATGSATLSATLSGVTGSTTLTVTPAQLVSLSVTPSNPSVARGRSQQLTATGTYSDASTQDLTTQVTWSSSNSAVVTVSNAVGSAGLASALATGSVTLSATLSGVTGSTTLTVTPAQLVSLSVTPSNPSVARGRTQQLAATGTYSDASTQDLTAQVIWSSSDASIATVSNAAGSAGLASAIDTGSATLSATLSGITGSTFLTVTPAQLVSLAVTPANPSVARGRTQQLTATGTYSDASTQDLTTQVTWASSDASIATVSNAVGSAGLASAIATGSATLSATLSGVTGSTTLTVTPAQLVSLSVTPSNPSVARGRSQQLTAIGTYSDASTQDLTTQVTWASSDASIATVSNAAGSAGLASAIAIGSATLSATLSGVTGSTLLTVTPAQLVSLSVTPSNPSVARGRTQQLTATGTYSDASTQDLTAQVTWSSSDASIATVSNAAGSAGLASAIATGSATLSATLSGVTGSTILTVTPAQLVSLAVTPANPSLPKGTTRQLTATGTYSDASTQDLTTQVTWSSSNPAIATVSNAAGSAGLATAVAIGSATLSATFGAVSGSTTATVTAPVATGLTVTPNPLTMDRFNTAQLTATLTFSDGSTQNVTTTATWSSSATTVASVSSQGKVSSTLAGTANITASFSTFTRVVPVTVSTCHVTINEIQTAGAGGASDEFVELYNGCTSTIDLSGSALFYRSATGTTNTTLVSAIPASTLLAPGGYLLYAGAGFTGTKDGSWTGGTGVLAGAAGGVGLQSTGGQLVDGAGWGGATNAFVEGTAAPAPASGSSIIRYPTNGQDTDRNSIDFRTTTTPTPRASNM